jgi:hypothetical protein
MDLEGGEFRAAVEATARTLRERIRAARRQGEELMTERELSEALAAEGFDVPYRSGLMRQVLSGASTREARARRGMVSAAVVADTGGKPAPGFVPLARQQPFGRRGSADQIWRGERVRLRRENRRPGDRQVTGASLGAWLLKCKPQV